MKIITDEILHLYVLNRNLVEESVISDIEEKIGTSEEFRKKIEKIKEFHEEFKRLNSNHNHFVNANTIILYPLSFITDISDNYIKLAADYHPEEKDFFKYQKTFASAENLILIRLHHNRKINKSRLYLISENMKSVANLKVKIPELNMEFVSDSRGIIEFDGINSLNVDSIIIEK